MAILSERLALLIDADTRGAVRGLNQVGQAARSSLGGTQSMMSKFTDSLRQAGPMIGAALGAAGYAFVQVADSASRLSSANGALQSTFGGMTGTMRDFAQEADRLGLSQAAAAEMSARLGGGLQALGFSAGDSAGEVQTLIERAADMSVGFGTTEEALNAISALLRGERDPIEQYGVAIKQVDVDARVAAKGLVGLTGEAKKNADAVASLELFYEATANRVGLYGSEANAAAREQQELTAKLENLQAELGTAVLPALVDLASGMNTAIEVGRVLAGVIGEMGQAATNAVPDMEGLLGSLPDWAQGAGDALGFVNEQLGGLIGPRRSDLTLVPPDEFARMQRGTADAVFSWLGLGDAVSGVTGLLGEAARAGGDAGEGLGDVAEEYESIFGELFAYQDALQGVEEGSERVAQAHRAHADAQRGAADAAEAVRQAAVDVAEAMIVQFDATEAARRGIDDYAAAQQAATDPVFAMIRALERQDELLKRSKGFDIEKDGTKMSASGSMPSLVDFAEGAAGVEQATIGLAGALRTGQTSIEQVRASLGKWVTQGLITQQQAGQLATRFDEVAQRAVTLEGATVDQAAAAGVAAAQHTAELEAAERTRDAKQRLEDAQRRLIDAQERVADTAGDVARAHDDGARKAWALDRAMFELNRKAQDNPGLISQANATMQDWVNRGLIPADEKARHLRDMLNGVNAAVAMFGGPKNLHIEVTSNALDFLNYLATNPTITAGSVRLRDRLAEQYPSGATGITVPGPMGQERMVIAHGGEQIVSNMDLARMRQSTGSDRSAPLMVVENITTTDVGSAIREANDELIAAQYRAGWN